MRAIEKTSKKTGRRFFILRIEADESMFELMDGSEGMCVACGHVQSGVEPDAEKYQCEDCEEYRVYGLEQMVLYGVG